MFGYHLEAFIYTPICWPYSSLGQAEFHHSPTLHVSIRRLAATTLFFNNHARLHLSGKPYGGEDSYFYN